MLHWLLTVSQAELGLDLPKMINSMEIRYDGFLGSGRSGGVYSVRVNGEQMVLKIAQAQYQSAIATEKKMLESLQLGCVR